MNNINIPELSKSINAIINEIEMSDLSLDELKLILVGKYMDVPVSIIKLLTATRNKQKQDENLKELMDLLNKVQMVKENKLPFEECRRDFSNKMQKRLKTS